MPNSVAVSLLAAVLALRAQAAEPHKTLMEWARDTRAARLKGDHRAWLDAGLHALALPVAIAAAIHLYALLWFLGDARALRNRVTRIDGNTLRLRLGLRWAADIPLRLIESVETGPSPVSSLRLKVLGATNLVLRLRQPIAVSGLFGITRRSSTLGVQLDDPEGLAAALRPLLSTIR